MTYPPSKTNRLFFDIESCACPENLALAPEPKAPANLKDPAKIQTAIEEKKRELIENAALDPDYGKVLSIGYAFGLDMPITVNAVGDRAFPDSEPTTAEYTLSENDLIEDFWDAFASRRGACVGFNILSFDLPFLMARSMYLGIKIPYLPMLAKFRTEPVTDLYAIRYNWGPGKGLKQVCKLLGIKNDCEGVDGSQVKDLDPETLRKYQASDVKLTIELYKRMNGVYFCH